MFSYTASVAVLQVLIILFVFAPTSSTRQMRRPIGKRRLQYTTKYNHWNLDVRADAVFHYVNKSHALQTTAKKFKIPRNTLRRVIESLPPHLLEKETCTKPLILERLKAKALTDHECKQLLTANEEAQLEAWIIRLSTLVRAPLKCAVEAKVIAIMALRKKTLTGQYVVPSRNWWEGFFKRHPTVSLRHGEALEVVRKLAQKNKESVSSFYSILGPLVHGLKADQIWVMDETGIEGDHNINAKVIARTAIKHAYVESSGYRDHVSILHICNAAGQTLPPMFIFQGSQNKVVDGLLNDCPPGCRIGWQENGYFSSEHLIDEIRCIIEFAKVNNLAPPRLLIYDGAACHISLSAFELAAANDLNILMIPAHTSHFLQVSDVSIFGPLKHYYAEECVRFYLINQRHLSIFDIAPTVCKAWSRACSIENVKSGFRATGIFPFDSNAINNDPNQIRLSTSKIDEATGHRVRRTVSCPPILISTASSATSTDTNATTPQLPPPVPVPADSTTDLSAILTEREINLTADEECGCLKYGHCISDHKKKVKRVALNSYSAKLLTSVEVMDEIKGAATLKQQKEKEKQEKKELAKQKKELAKQKRAAKEAAKEAAKQLQATKQAASANPANINPVNSSNSNKPTTKRKKREEAKQQEEQPRTDQNKATENETAAEHIAKKIRIGKFIEKISRSKRINVKATPTKVVLKLVR